MVIFCVKDISLPQDYYNGSFIESKGIHFSPHFVTGSLLGFIFLLTFQFFKNFKNKSCWPVCHTATQGYCNSSSFQNFLTTCTYVNSTADMIFNSSVAFITDTDSQCYEFFIFLGKRTIFQRMSLNLSNLTKSVDSALVHLQIVLLPCLFYLITIRKHSTLLKRIKPRLWNKARWPLRQLR